MSKLSREARSIIDAARGGEEPPDAIRARVRREVLLRAGGVAVASTLATKTAVAGSAAGGASVGVGLATKIAIVAFVGTIGAGTALWATRDAPSPIAAPPLAQSAQTAMPLVEAPPRALGEEPPAPAEQEAPPEPTPTSTPVIVAPPKPSTPAKKEHTEPHAGKDTIEAEVGLLREAQDALRAGRADKALSILEDHEKSFSGGALGEERRAARVFALCAMGKPEAARIEAERFLRESPRSPLAARVRAACIGE